MVRFESQPASCELGEEGHMTEWECPICGDELVALDREALRPHIIDHRNEHEDDGYE
ncbi:hypothetical protein GCM10009651_35960 [Microbacterium natoriense]